MGIIWSSGLLLFLFADWLHIPYYVGPVSTWVVWLILFSLPVPLLYWRSRWWLFKEIVSGCGLWVCMVSGLLLEQLLKFIKNPILIGISSNFLHNISTCICIRKIIKLENSLLVIFAKIWPMTLYYSTGTLTRFLRKLKIRKKSNFDQNQLKLSIQHKYLYMYEKKIIKMENSLLVFFDENWPKSLYYSTGNLAQFLSNFKNL